MRLVRARVSSLAAHWSHGSPSEQRPARRLVRLATNSAADLLAHLRIPSLPHEAIVPIAAASRVLLMTSRSPWYFSAQTYAQESALAQELASRAWPFGVTTEPSEIFGKSVIWFLPVNMMAPRLWDYSRQVREFVAGLERQGNEVFCSAEETSFWENKAYMHRMLEEIGAPTPETRLITSKTWESTVFDIEPVLVKLEHSAGSAGIHYFGTAGEARQFVENYPFRPAETLIMQEVVRGATRDLRLTLVGDQVIQSTTYWRTKSPEALAGAEWTTTATTYNSVVDHSAGIPDAAVTLMSNVLQRLKVRTAGIDLMWPNDDLTADPLILEFSPYYQPNPPKPPRYDHLSYGAFKNARRFAREGYLERQFATFRDIASQILDQGLF